MTMQWSMPDVPEQETPEPPPVWLFVVLYVAMELAAVALTVFNWPKGQPTMTGTFWACVLLLPTLLWVTVGAAFVAPYEDARNDSDWWNLLRQYRTAYWQQWAHGHMWLMDSVVLTPEDALAERMLGLEGLPPTNPGKALVLPRTETTRARARLDSLFEQLLTPLATTVRRLTRLETPYVVLQVGDDDCSADLLHVWKRLSLPDSLRVTWLAPDEPSPLAEHWFGEEIPGCRLVIACQLQTPESEPPCSETAVALLLSNPDAVTRARLKLKPQAWIFRPIVAESDAVDEALATLLSAGQASSGKIRHCWYSRLGRIVRNATMFAVNEAGLNVMMQDVDRALGNPGPVNAWLLQAMAAQMVQHGQGAQLVATPYRTGVSLNLVATSPPPVVWPNDDIRVPFFCYSFFVGMAMLLAFVLVLTNGVMPPSPNDPSLFSIACFAIPLIILLRTGVALWQRRENTHRFCERFY